MGSFMPLPFGNRERGPRQLFSSETTQARLTTLQNTLQLIDGALQHGQFPGMSFDEQPAVKHETAPTYAIPTEVAAGAAALQEVQAPASEAEVAQTATPFVSPQELVMHQMVEVAQHEFTQAA
jgi:hypothetical protein